MTFRAWSVAILALAPTACVKDRPVPAAEDAGVPAVIAAAKPPRYDEVPRPMPGATPTVISGKVLEILKVPTYTYLLLDTDKEKVWAAVPLAEVEVGATVTVERAMLMAGYRSAQLEREFDRVYFGLLVGAPAGGNAGNPHAAMGAPDADVRATKASGPNAKTVEEVITQGSRLRGKPVRVRGVVVKINTKILGKTWIHVQDGTGMADAKTRDLLVTSTSPLVPKLGDTISIEGAVSTNKDFGSGYNYAVVVEDATLEIAAPK